MVDNAGLDSDQGVVTSLELLHLHHIDLGVDHYSAINGLPQCQHLTCPLQTVPWLQLAHHSSLHHPLDIQKNLTLIPTLHQ